MSRFLILLLFAACTAAPPSHVEPETDELPYDLGKGDAVVAESLSAFHGDLRGDALILDTSLTSGQADGVVFSSSWWPHRNNGLAWRWNAPVGSDDEYDVTSTRGMNADDLSPVEKYDLLFEHRGSLDDVGGFDAVVPEITNSDGTHPEVEVVGPATAWTLRNRGRWRTSFPANWEGYCNGWSAYSTTDPHGAPLRDVRVRFESGAAIECVADEEGCVLFRMADIEALMIGVYFDDGARMIGGTCWESSWQRDELGRPLNRDCRDVNPADFHVITTSFLGRGVDGHQKPYIVDHVAGPDIWNFPVVRFESAYGARLGRSDAAGLVCPAGAACDADAIFEPSTVAWVEVDTTYYMASDDVGAEALRVQASARHIDILEVPVRYLLELDAEDRIIGGHWLGSSIDNHPDIVWYSESHRSTRELPNDTNGSWDRPLDNPHLRYDYIEALILCANEPETCSPTSGPPPEENPCSGACGDHVELTDGTTCSCDPCCYVYENCCDADGGQTASRRTRDLVCDDMCWFGEP